MGCSDSTSKMIVGCHPVQKECKPHVLLQISTDSRASQCYCMSDGCNKPKYEFKMVPVTF